MKEVGSSLFGPWRIRSSEETEDLKVVYSVYEICDLPLHTTTDLRGLVKLRRWEGLTKRLESGRREEVSGGYPGNDGARVERSRNGRKGGCDYR